MTCDDIRDLAPAFVLGALERHEERAVAEHLSTCPEAHEEMAELGQIVPYLDESVPLVEPPASLRARILAAAADDLASRRLPAGASPTVAEVTPIVIPRIATAGPRAEPEDSPARPAAQVISLGGARRDRRDLRTWALGIAAVLAIVALGAWNTVTVQELNASRSHQARFTAALVQAGQPGSQVAVLTSTGASPAVGIAVMPGSGNGTLVVTGLTPTRGSQVYEAWAMVDGRPPTPVAGFTVGPDGTGYLDKMPSASGEIVTVALTLEPAPNPTAPSSEPIAAGVARPGSEPA